VIPLLLVLAVLVLLAAWLTAGATAVRSVSRIWLRHWVEQQLGSSVTAEAYLSRPQRLLVAAGAGMALVVTLAGEFLGQHHEDRPWQLALEAIVLALVLLVAGQLVPRAIARRWAQRLVGVLLPPLHVAAFLMGPLIGAAQAVGRAVRPRSGATSAESPRDGIEDLLREGELEGIGEREEIEIITGVVQFGDKVLRDVMTPRTDVFAVDVDAGPREIARAIARSGYSRVPVYRASVDEIIGVVHVFDVLKEGGERMPPIREVAHAPASKRCSEMLFEMLRGQRHLAVVVDEFGGTAGIVTLEDVLEELVGEIRDEHDEPATTDAVTTGRAAMLDAALPLEDVTRCFGVELAPELYDRARSLGGLVVRALGRIPGIGERFRLGELEVTVVEAEPARLLRVLVQRAESAPPVELKLAR
jgi:putative hemolysin